MTHLTNAPELHFGWPEQPQTLSPSPKSLVVPRQFRFRFGHPLGAEERAFQDNCLDRVWSSLRVMALFMACVFMAYSIRDCCETHSLFLTAPQNGAPALFFVWVFALTWVPDFRRSYSLFVVGGALVTAFISMATIAASSHPGTAEAQTIGTTSVGGALLGQQMRLLMVCFAALRLRWKWAFILHTSILLGGTVAFVLVYSSVPEEIARFLQTTWAVMVAATLAAWIEEQWARTAFEANQRLEHLNRALEGERDMERSKREHSEKTLHVLSQAIGSIAHDLGSPLATIQMGAGMLDMALEGRNADLNSLRHLTSTIECGTQMLDCLRLSLIEQTRALEGKSTPVHLCPVSLRGVLEAGARFGSLRSTRGISLPSGDMQIYADEKKMVTVWMNLIDNALKYSGDDVCIEWRTLQDPCGDYEPQLLLAVLDKGTNGQGLSLSQAKQLFEPFGRLDVHSHIEGTGLGLLSVRAIIEAHGGQVWIEGFENGTPTTSSFSTACGHYPSMLGAGFRTAFVVTCSLAL